MLPLLFILIIIGILVGYSIFKIRHRDQTSLSGMSWPARQIVKQYENLPAANRPWGNIEYIVKALDIKHEVSKVNYHFEKYNGWDKSEYSWRGCYNTRSCEFQEYHSLHDELDKTLDALQKQEHALKVAGVTDGLAAAHQLMESLRQEQKIISETTKELTQ